MLDVFNTPTGATSNFQIFYDSGDWVKPRGASLVRFLLIGAGSGGSSGTAAAGGGGGGSGAVTSWIGPAIFVPDVLRIDVGSGGTSGAAGNTTSVIYQQKDGTGYTLLSANAGSAAGTGTAGGVGGTAFAGLPFASSGIWNSFAGQNGATASTSLAASTTTFVSGGGGGSSAVGTAGGGVTGQWGESVPTTTAGGSAVASRGRDSLLTFPFYSLGGAGGSTNDTVGTAGGNAGIGSGGGGSGEDALTGGRGGDGLVVVWAW